MANPNTETDNAANKRVQNWKALPDGQFIWQRNRKTEARIVPSDALQQLKRLRNLELFVSLALGIPIFLLMIAAIKGELATAWPVMGLIGYGCLGIALHRYCKSRIERIEGRYPKAESILRPIDIAAAFLAGMPDSLLRRSLFLTGGGALAAATELGSLLLRGKPFTNGEQVLSWPGLVLVLIGGAFAAYHLNRERIRRKHARKA